MKLHPIIANSVWAGLDEAAYEASEALYRMQSAEMSPQFLEMVNSSMDSEWTTERGVRGSHLLTRDKDTALLHINGPLLNIDSPYSGYFGITTYADIKRAAGLAAADEGIKATRLLVSSGGGAADGAEDAYSTLIKLGQVKALDTHAVGAMCSAALWLGMAGATVTCSATSLVGSIGTIQPVISQVGAMEKEGYSVEVFRSGKYKAPGHPMENMTDAQRALIQERLDDLSTVFHEAVAARYNLPIGRVRETFGEGRTFVGRKAVDVGLVMAVASTESLRDLDKVGVTQLNIGNHTESPMSTPSQPQAQNSPPPVTPPAAPAAPAAAVVSGEVFAYVQSQLTQVNEANTALRAQVAGASAVEAGLQAKLAEAEAAITSLSTIVLGSVNAMRVALNQPALPAGASAADLLSQHGLMHEVYAKAFPVGGVSVPSIPGAGATAAHVPSPAHHAARVKAVF
jgi:ClpP class serine protease